MVDAKVLEKYEKILTMAERAEGNERATAAGIAAKMRLQHPTLEADYEQYVYRKLVEESDKGEDFSGGSEHPQHTYSSPNQHQNTGSPFWDFAQNIYHTAADFASTISDAVMGTHLARQVKVTSRLNRKDSVVVSFSLSPDVLDHLDEFNGAQRIAFRNSVLAMVQEELDEILFPQES